LSAHKIESLQIPKSIASILKNEDSDDNNNDKNSTSTIAHGIRASIDPRGRGTLQPILSKVQADISGIFDESVVPQELIDELYEDDRVRPLLEGSSFYELFDRYTDSGTAIKWYRKVQQEEEDDMRNYVKQLQRVPVVKDIGGGVTRSQLESMSQFSDSV
jgi:hypothetical protein